ncbi:MAG: type II secretion system F family protein [Candidatus Omnitrophota bacterium]
MNSYRYKARDRFGKAVSGSMEAYSEENVAIKLKEVGYAPIVIKKEKYNAGFKTINWFKGVSISEVSMFTRQFASLQKAGLPVLASLDALKDQIENVVLRKIIGQVSKDIESGMALSTALEKHPKAFNEIYVSMLRAAEVSGALDETLERLAIVGEKDAQIKRQIKTATRYPIIVVCSIIIGFLVLITVVVPRFANLYSQFQTALPLPTRLLIWVNLAVTKFGLYTAFLLVLTAFLFRKFVKTSRGRQWLDNLKLKIPVFGKLILELSMSRFARVTGILMRSGVPILKILELASASSGNIIISQALDNVQNNVSAGKGMAEPMKFSGLFPSAVTRMVAVGEETGKTDEMMMHVADYYEAQSNYKITNLTTLIEPILILVLGSVVLLMALGIFLPMWNMMRLFIGN